MTQLIRSDLVDLIRQNAGGLRFPSVFVVDDTLEPVDPQIFLAAFSLNESSGGYNNRPKHEDAYDIGGKYCKGKQLELIQQYGSQAACSYSSFQLMFICFYEMGFTPTPLQAGNDQYALPVVVKFFNKRIFKDGKANDVNFICLAADAYNSGNWKDKNVPADYIKKITKHYHEAWNSALFVPTVDKDAPKPWQGNIK